MQARPTDCLLVIAAAMLLGSCGAADTDASQGKADRSNANAKFARIDKLARQSCQCKLAGKDSSRLDTALKAETAGLRINDYGEPSAPLAGDYKCYPDLGEETCTATYYLTSAPQSVRVCTLDQVDRLEKTWKAADLASDGSTAAADAALQKTLAAIRQDLAKSIPQSACD